LPPKRNAPARPDSARLTAGNACDTPHSGVGSLDDLLALDDAGFRRREGGHGRHVRFAASDLVAADELQIAGAVGQPALSERVERTDLVIVSRDDQLAAPRMGDVVLAAELVEERPALDRQARFEGVRRIVDAGVDDAAVVRAGLEPVAAVALDDRHAPRRRQLGRDRQPDRPGADDGDIHVHADHRSGGGDLAHAARDDTLSARTAEGAMPKTESFDVTTGVDLQEVDNAVNQARKEIAQRYDFKGQKAEIEYDRAKALLTLRASDEYYLNALWQVLQERMISRKVPVKNLHRGKVEPASGGTVRQEVVLKQGISPETARAIVKLIKDQKLKKVQTQIQGDAVRIFSPSRDDLQGVQALLRRQEYDVELKYGNYR
jgi:hypothetical protein